MDPQLLQRTRYLLQARTRRATTCPPSLITSACKQLTTWIDNHPLLGPVASNLRQQHPNVHNSVASMLREVLESGGSYDPGRLPALTLEEHATACLALVRGIAAVSKISDVQRQFVLDCICEYLTGNNIPDGDEAIEVFRDVAIEGLYEYLDEQLDTRNMAFGILSKYKQRSENFYRLQLRDYANHGLEKKMGERALAIDLYRYLLDQGVEFSIEAQSASGEPDVILRDTMGQHLVIDAKYISKSSKRSTIGRKIAEGLHQVLRYCDDYHESFGFLVCYVEDTARIHLPMEETDGLQYIKIGGKTVYYTEIRIADAPSASKAGTAVEHRFGRNDLVKLVDTIKEEKAAEAP